MSKRYGERVALADVHLKVKPGQLHGLLGANGAGAIPLLRILLGLAARDSGTVRLLGRELRSTREPMERKPGLPASPRRSSRSPAAAAVRLLPPASNRRSAMTFANLVDLQVKSLGLPPMRREDVAVRATCRRPTGTAEPGSGDWICTVAWQGPDGRPLRDTYDVFVATEGCYMAGAEAATLGGPTITTSEGRAVKNLLYKFEGCFNTI